MLPIGIYWVQNFFRSLVGSVGRAVASQHQRSAFQIQSSANFYIGRSFVNCQLYLKDDIKNKRGREWPVFFFKKNFCRCSSCNNIYFLVWHLLERVREWEMKIRSPSRIFFLLLLLRRRRRRRRCRWLTRSDFRVGKRSRAFPEWERSDRNSERSLWSKMSTNPEKIENVIIYIDWIMYADI